MKLITDIINLIKGLTADKSGTFILGISIPVIPCYFIISSLRDDKENHLAELKKVELRELYWKNKSDTCEINSAKAYQNGFNEGRVSVRQQLDETRKMYDDIEKSLSNKEQKIRREIDKAKKELKK